MDMSHFFRKRAEQICKIFCIKICIWLSYASYMDWILHLAPGVPAPVEKALKKLLHKRAAIYSLVICFLCQINVKSVNSSVNSMSDLISVQLIREKATLLVI